MIPAGLACPHSLSPLFWPWGCPCLFPALGVWPFFSCVVFKLLRSCFSSTSGLVGLDNERPGGGLTFGLQCTALLGVCFLMGVLLLRDKLPFTQTALYCSKNFSTYPYYLSLTPLDSPGSLFCFVLFEIGSHYVVLASLELSEIWPPCSAMVLFCRNSHI